MFPDNFEELLMETVSNALERMAFMIGEPIDLLDGDVHHASHIAVNVDGQGCTVSVRATDGALQELLAGLVDAENFDDEEAQLAVNELANILGGEVQRVLGGDVLPSSIGLPQGDDESDAGAEDDTTVRAALDFFGDGIEVSVTPTGVCA